MAAVNNPLGRPLPVPVVDAGPKCYPGIGDLFQQPSRAEVTEANRLAIRVCNGDPDEGWLPCPAARECLAWAVRHDEDGIWGGTTYRQRQAMTGSEWHAVREARPQDSRIPHGTVSGYNWHSCRCGDCKTAASRARAAQRARTKDTA